MLGGAILRHTTINLTDNSQVQSLTFLHRVMKLTSVAAFCFITLLAQIFSVSLAVGSSARKKKKNMDAFLNSAPALWVLCSFSGLLAAIIINFSYFKCECVDGVVAFQHRSFSLRAQNEITQPIYPYRVLTPHCLAGHWFEKSTYCLRANQSQRKPPPPSGRKVLSRPLSGQKEQLVWFNPSLHGSR